MGEKRPKLSDQIRQAIDSSGFSRYAICKKLEIKEAQMSRFMAGKGWIGQDNLDALAALLNLHVMAGKRREKKRK
jgi:hypothetical protein